MPPLEMSGPGDLEWGQRICIFKYNKLWVISKYLSLSHPGLNQRWVLVLLLYLNQTAVVLPSTGKRCIDNGLGLFFILAKVIQR